MLKTKLENLEKWFEDKARMIALNFASRPVGFHCRAGEIYFAHMGVNIGGEIDKSRPVIVFQGDRRVLAHSSLVNVLPVTSSINGGIFDVLISDFDVDGGSCSGEVRISQMRVVSKSRLVFRIGNLSAEKLNEIRAKVYDFLFYQIK